MKNLIEIVPAPRGHWVGDGFPVRSIFSYQDLGPRISPFLLMDYAGPAQFPPTEERRGVGSHPHKGFETVTIVYQGEVDHRDSTGNAGHIGPGDVQWMTAASGLVHEEFHGRDFARRGGTFEMIQLWVNLTARDKKAAPGYQTLLDANIPAVALPQDSGSLRVIAGDYNGAHGPAHTFTPINLWDVRLKAGHSAEFRLPAGHNAAVFVLHGELKVGDKTVREAELALFDREGEGIAIEAVADTTLLVLSGEPIDEPVVGRGPFVMNTEAEIYEAIREFQNGKMGVL